MTHKKMKPGKVEESEETTMFDEFAYATIALMNLADLINPIYLNRLCDIHRDLAKLFTDATFKERYKEPVKTPMEEDL